MSLEHRWSPRKRICLHAIVFYQPLGLAQAVIQNIGLEGAFISGETLNLPLQSLVELTFALTIAGKQTIYQMEAMAIHRARDGYGLMFKDFKLEAFQALREMLYAA